MLKIRKQTNCKIQEQSFQAFSIFEKKNAPDGCPVLLSELYELKVQQSRLVKSISTISVPQNTEMKILKAFWNTFLLYNKLHLLLLYFPLFLLYKNVALSAVQFVLQIGKWNDTQKFPLECFPCGVVVYVKWFSSYLRDLLFLAVGYNCWLLQIYHLKIIESVFSHQFLSIFHTPNSIMLSAYHIA